MEDQCLPSDIISTIPQNIIEMILTLMPIRDAVRTSILSRKWRYNWVKIPKLVFDHKLFNGLTLNNKKSKRRICVHAIKQVMLLHEGLVLELTLNRLEVGKGFEIDQILTRNNTLKKFTLNAFYKLPSSFYSLEQLTHLNLKRCHFQPPSTFNGFNMLTSLSLDQVVITEKVLLHLISGCPILKHFTLLASNSSFAFEEESGIVQLFSWLSLTVVEHLSLNLYPFMWFFPGEVPQKLTALLINLKHLDFSEWCSFDRDEFRFTLLLIRICPNLEKIKIKINEEQEDFMKEIDVFLALQDYVDIRLDRLTEFEVEKFRNSITVSELLKLILVKSPMLKKVHLKLGDVERGKKEIKLLRSSVLTLPRASPVVDIIVQRLGWRDDSEDYE